MQELEMDALTELFKLLSSGKEKHQLPVRPNPHISNMRDNPTEGDNRPDSRINEQPFPPFTSLLGHAMFGDVDREFAQMEQQLAEMMNSMASQDIGQLVSPYNYRGVI